MTVVNCKQCNKKLGEIEENPLSITFEEGVKAQHPTVSLGVLIAPFDCPDCNTTQVEMVVI